MALFVPLPLSLFINWRLASVLVVLCVVFTALTALVIRKTEKLQSRSKATTPRSPSASDALSNIALVQGYARIRGRGGKPARRGEPAARRADAGAVVVGDHRV